MENKKKSRANICAAPYRRPNATEAPHELHEQQNGIPDKLLLRATQINNCLLLSLKAVLDAKVAIDADRLACKELACELTNWERALADLEAAILANRLEKGVLEIDSQATRSQRDPSQNDPSQNNPSQIVTSQIDASQIDSVSPENRDGNELLQTIKLQKSQIGALESKLNRLLQSQPPATPTNEPEYSAEKQDPAASGAQSKRLLITIARGGNLKFPISQDVMTIGRQPTNDIHIRSRYLSRLHARIVSGEKGAFIEDLDSANGVIVNSRRVRRCLLRSGDRITLGKTHMQYIDIEEDTEDAGQA